MTRSYWLSFADDSGFRGVCLIDVPEAAARHAKTLIDAQFPQHAPDAEWLAAATRIAHAYGCNPGGEVGSIEITGIDDAALVAAPRNRLLSAAELEQLGLAERP